MPAVFDKNGNLPSTLWLEFAAFERDFGFTETRKLLLEKAKRYFRILSELGCKEIIIAGSFVSDKPAPGDIDLCVDITSIDYPRLKRDFQELLKVSGIDSIKKNHQVHFALFFDFGSYELLDFFKKDRNDFPRGLVHVSLDFFKKL